MLRTAAFFVLVSALVGLGCGGNGMTGPSTASTFSSVSPAGGATGVSTSTGIVMRFSQHMGAGMEQFVDLHEGDPAGPVVPMGQTETPLRASRRRRSSTRLATRLISVRA